MDKEYKSVQELLELQTLVADKEGGCYFVESMMDSLEAKAEEYKQNKLTLEAKTQEVLNLNGTIENMKTTHAEELENLKNAHADEVKNLNDTHAEEINTLNAQLDSLKTAHAEELENLKNAHADEVKNLQDQITALQADKEELIKAGAPQPKAPAGKAGEGAQEETTGAHSVTTSDMTIAQMREALEARKRQL